MAHTVRDKRKLLSRVRKIRGQIEAIERHLVEEADCGSVLNTIAACRGALNALMAEVMEGHVRSHVANPDVNPDSERAIATRQLIDVIRTYLK